MAEIINVQILRVLLKLHHSKKSQRFISNSLNINRRTISNYLVIAQSINFDISLLDTLDDNQLKALFLRRNEKHSKLKHEDISWENVHKEMQKKGATLKVLHQEYLTKNPDGMRYTIFSNRYRRFKTNLKLFMRQKHIAGEKVFVDYSGGLLKIHDPKTAKIMYAQIFIGVLGCSVATYAEAHWSQGLQNWIEAHTRMFEYFGGIPKILVCDNLKAAVTKAGKYDVIINSTYLNMADFYGTTIMPTRIYKPKDKAKVENAVLIVQRWILFRVRNEIFYSLSEANNKIRVLLDELNNKPFTKISGTRFSRLSELDRPAMIPLPEKRYEYVEFRRARVGFDYHVEFDGSYYSVPYKYANEIIELRINVNSIEVLHKGQRIASHIRDYSNNTITSTEHMTSSHKYMKNFDLKHEFENIKEIGVNVYNYAVIVDKQAKSKRTTYNFLVKVKSMSKILGYRRVDYACAYAIKIGANTLTNLKQIIDMNLDNNIKEEGVESVILHENIRGSSYYK